MKFRLPFERERGTVLFLALIVAMLLLLTLAAATTTAHTSARSARFQLDRTQSLAVAEGVTETVQKQMLSQVANFEPLVLSGDVTLGGAEHPYAITPLGDTFTRTDNDGVSHAIRHYLIATDVNLGDGYAKVNRVVDLTQTPIFQFMIFYDDDLEILPGPNMTLEGRVHANGDLYVGCGNTVTVDTEYFRATGSILRQRKNDGSESTGQVDIKVTGEDTFVNMTTANDAELPEWTTYALDTWQGTVQDGAHGVREVESPSIGSIKSFLADGSKGYYHSEAGLVIADGKAYDASGELVSLPDGTITQEVMYDGREGKNIKVTEVDMGLLNSSGKFPSNGLLYSYRTDSTPSEPNGIRLTNGAEIAAPLTVVSEDPVYVHGDFNTVDKKGCAVLSDAVNLLSNAWNDSKNPGSLPAAADTTYNLAFITGNVRTPDGGGNYSGGFENLPRFHENWTGRTAKIRGSFVNMYESEIAKSPWRYGGDVYKAPVRDWRYDRDLLTHLPPFTPNAVSFERVLWDDGVPPAFTGI